VHRFDLTRILGWWLHGLVQYVREIAPLISPSSESGPPEFWYEYFQWSDWDWNISDAGIPNATLLRNWLWAVKRLLGRWIEETADGARDAALGFVRSWIGFALHGFGSFSDWIESLWHRAGEYVPGWATSLADAATRLYLWIPGRIRNGVASWDSWLDQKRDEAISWIESRWADLWSEIPRAVAWIFGAGGRAVEWVDRTRSFIDDLRSCPRAWLVAWLADPWRWLENFYRDPAGTIAGLLGDPWPQLVEFSRSALLFWRNLWGSHAAEIGRFWEAPLEWLYERIEDFLCEKW
jgi:hypothetical protein